ncbi:DUF4838 domain-containing protein [Paenibacillus eucommiae]|uniref:SLH domain-containing protein n=1 Tax=Paenibacillus eucommiae TaxID=1355755 RepID=A0ABS4J8F9_9BACL|nr:DUF4838 domain-containing protein [Paenibacillus eucommiae]MBP1996122.1 hypothetical protein [Paenibacillus eucommiae]
MFYLRKIAQNVLPKLLIAALLFSVLSFEGFIMPGTASGQVRLTDIGSSYAKAEIEQLAAAGIVSGYADGTFAPGKPITRAELAKIITAMMKLNQQPDEAKRFADVAKDSWYRGYVGALIASGITQGTSETTFSPDAYVTREQLVVFMIRAFGLEEHALNLQEAAEWSDVNLIADWAASPIALALHIGFVQGIANADGSLRFAPKEYAERQAVARLAFEFVTMYDAYKEKAGVSPQQANTASSEPKTTPAPMTGNGSNMSPSNEPTSTSWPTPTPEPTSTPEPTYSPGPTSSPEPTASPEPSPEPLAVVSGGQPKAVIVYDDSVYEAADTPWASGIPGWQQTYGADNDGTLGIADAVRYAGSYSLHVDHVVGGRNTDLGLESDFIAVQEQETYTVSAMVYRESGNVPQIYIRFFDSNKARISQQLTNANVTAGEWTQVSVTAAAPAGTAYVTIILYSGIAPASVYFDDITLIGANNTDIPVLNGAFEPEADTRYGSPELLAEYVQKSTGAVLPIMSVEDFQNGGGQQPGQLVILIGTAASVSGDDPALDALLDGLDRDGFVIYPQEQQVTIAGPSIWGTLNGVLDFLERYADIRWLMPGPAGEDIPQRSDLHVALGIVREEPAFMFRVFSPLHGKPGTGTYVMQEQYTWAQRNRLQGFYNAPVSFHHNMDVLFSVSKFGATHPEFYPNGTPPAAGVTDGWQPCFSNPDTIDAAVAEIIAYFQANPNSESYSLGVNDGGGFCESNPLPVYYDWVNKVVESVLDVYPNKWFGLLAYTNLETPPSFPLNPRVIPFLTKDRMAWADPVQKAKDLANVDNWLEVADQLAYYDYIYGSPYLVPRVYPHFMSDIYRQAHEKGIKSIYAEIYPNWGEGAKPWVDAKLLWNPEQDVDALLQEWYERAVGEAAAPYLRAYYDYWEQFWMERVIDEPWFNSGATYLDFMDPAYLQAATVSDVTYSRGVLETVEVLAVTDEQKARAHLLMQAFEYYEASVLSYPQPTKPLPDANSAITLLDEIIGSIDERVQMAEKRFTLLTQFATDPVLFQPLGPMQFSLLSWSGWSAPEFWSFVEYMNEHEAAGGPLRTHVTQLAATHAYADMLLQALGATNAVQNPSFATGTGTEAPPWELLNRSTANRFVERSEYTGFSDSVSMKVYGEGWGGPSQVIDVEPGLFSTSFRYHIPLGTNSDGNIQWGIDLLNEQGTWLNYNSVRSPVVDLADAEGAWLEAHLYGEIPDTINGEPVRKARLIVLVDNNAPIELYIDDVEFYSISKQ